MRVLAGTDRGLEPVEAVAARELEELLGGRMSGRVVPHLGHDRVGQLVVPRVGRQRRVEVDAVTIEVDVIFVDSPHPPESVRVDRVHDDDGEVARDRDPVTEPLRLTEAARETLDPVGARNHQQPVRCVGIPELRNVGREHAPVGTAVGMHELAQRRVLRSRRVEKRRPRVLIVIGESHRA